MAAQEESHQAPTEGLTVSDSGHWIPPWVHSIDFVQYSVVLATYLNQMNNPSPLNLRGITELFRVWTLELDGSHVWCHFLTWGCAPMSPLYLQQGGAPWLQVGHVPQPLPQF